VDDHERAVLGPLDVVLDDVGLLGDRQADGREGVLGRGAGRAAVRDHVDVTGGRCG
jgi:hypothetical protein